MRFLMYKKFNLPFFSGLSNIAGTACRQWKKVGKLEVDNLNLSWWLLHRTMFLPRKYKDFNDHHLTDKLKAKRRLSYRGRRCAGFFEPTGSVPPGSGVRIKHRSRRERREAEGMMLQVDGSPHDWLQGRGPRLCLIGAIDDATSKVIRGSLVEAESSWGYFKMFSDTFRQYGLPQSVYNRPSFGVLDRPGTDDRRAVDWQETHHRSGPGLSRNSAVESSWRLTNRGKCGKQRYRSNDFVRMGWGLVG